MSVVFILKARRYGHSQILRLLLEAQATVDERDSGGGTALLKVQLLSGLSGTISMSLQSSPTPPAPTHPPAHTPRALNVCDVYKDGEARRRG